jgi:hypothetical protein
MTNHRPGQINQNQERLGQRPEQTFDQEWNPRPWDYASVRHRLGDPSGLTPERLGDALRSLPKPAPKTDLRTSLRVIASKERQRKLQRRDWKSRYAYWRDRFDLVCEELIRPLALPFAGGVFSTVLLFSMFVPSFIARVDASPDVPTMLTTQAGIRGLAPFSANGDELVVDVIVDGQGRMVDYNVVTGATVLHSPDTRRRLENMLLFTSFTPATQFGQPTRAKIRLWFQSSRVDVKG